MVTVVVPCRPPGASLHVYRPQGAVFSHCSRICVDFSSSRLLARFPLAIVFSLGQGKHRNVSSDLLGRRVVPHLAKTEGGHVGRDEKKVYAHAVL